MVYWLLFVQEIPFQSHKFHTLFILFYEYMSCLPWENDSAKMKHEVNRPRRTSLQLEGYLESAPIMTENRFRCTHCCKSSAPTAETRSDYNNTRARAAYVYNLVDIVRFDRMYRSRLLPPNWWRVGKLARAHFDTKVRQNLTHLIICQITGRGGGCIKTSRVPWESLLKHA